MSEPTTAGAGGLVLEVRGLQKHYQGFHAVRGVDLDLHRGEILSLLGPSGCGKTTTLRTVIGLERADGGEIRYRGELVDDGARRVVPIHRRNMGMVFQSYAIWPHMTVAENVAYPLRVRRMPKAERIDAVRRVLSLVGLAELAERKATNLSGGQQQRVALARALVFEPDLLLLDEPFSNLDARLRDEMRAEVRMLQRRLDISVLFVTHDQHEALSVSDRIAVMSQGQIQQIGPPTELYERPATPMVRSFLGQNIVVPGSVTRVAGGAATVAVQVGTPVEVHGRLAIDDCVSAGDGCEFSVRPQHVTVRAGEPRGSAETNGLAGRLVSLLFVGDRYEAHVALDAGKTATLLLPTGIEPLAEGSRVTLEFSPEHVLVWPASPTPTDTSSTSTSTSTGDDSQEQALSNSIAVTM